MEVTSVKSGKKVVNYTRTLILYSLKYDHVFILLFIRTTMPLVSYIRISLRFWYYAFLSTSCQNLEKLGSLEKFGKKGGQTFKESDREKSQF